MDESKINKKTDAYGHDVDDSGKTSRHESNLKPLNIRIRFDIRFVFENSRIFDSIFDSNEIPYSSHPDVQAYLYKCICQPT